MKRIGILGAAMLATFVFVQPAAATPLVGNLSVTINYLPNCGNNTTDCTTLGTATALDFIAFLGAAASPGVAGVEVVNSADGNFSGLIGASGLIKDFSFAGAGTANFPKPVAGAPILAWETIGGLTFDMLTVSITLQNATSLVLDGTGLFHMAGFDNTPGSFTLSANQSGTSFSASASKGTVPDAGSTMFLLGTALAGLAAVRRRLQ